MIGNLLLACALALALATVLFAVNSIRTTRQRYYDEFIKRKRNGG